ncbi:CRM-domain containing factor CFM3, chloroplastic/mitochondrial [Oryza brachyantha]|uniref:CRM-domain containing factor CFM3, chloroplastic/mitochondrial n=1 Tax=Oryza brachyantha TaxID=4533 RepID=UPI001ADC84DF|nr:CRM-domain containing factor CFM3, chloroplastic/mitochondrial [Oryza brachyantha]
MAAAAMAPTAHLHLHHPPRLHRLLLLSTSPYPWLSAWPSPRARLLPRRPASALDLRPEPSPSSDSDDEDAFGTSRSSGRSTMTLILGRLRQAGYYPPADHASSSSSSSAALPGAAAPRHPPRGSVEDVFRVDDGVLPNARGGFDDGGGESALGDARFPWELPMPPPEAAARAARSKSWMAELTLPEAELRRLRHAGMRLKSRIKVGGAGVTKDIVERIRDRWRTEEVVRIKVTGTPALNMRLFHEILERKTGGLVIWRSGTSVSLYRGVAYDIPEPTKRTSKNMQTLGMMSSIKESPGPSLLPNEKVNNMQDTNGALLSNTEKDRLVEPVPEIKYEDEINKLLDELGPRYTDWPRGDPSPVDADLLPATVPGYKPPFRVLPYGVRPSLGRRDTTNLRRLARGLPPHFALGRSRQLQGLAAAMVKLWEKSSIAKIALKRGVQLTTSERMAEDIKKLTGGVMLSRNNDFIVFYRGKDFLSSELAEALLERERLAKSLQDEEQARLNAASSFASSTEAPLEPTVAGTLGETLEANSKYGNKLDENFEDKMTRTVEAARHADLVRKLEWKLSLAEKKIAKAERVLGKVETALKPTEGSKLAETITDEERFMFRKLGLRMKAFLLLGRRGVFDGTIENMHLHWKYRELVKILVKAKSFGEVKKIALSLEAESGGILVSVDKVSKGYAIVVFRGKDYRRPSKLRPRNLLSKRKALARSIEIQRREALSRHIASLNRRVKQLKSELIQMEGVKEEGDEELYAKLDSAYSSDEEDGEDEDDEAYLRSFDNVAGHSGDDRTSVDGSNINSEDEGDYSEDDENEDDDDEDDEFDYENDDDDAGEDDVSPVTSDGNLYSHTDLDSSRSENGVSLSARGDPDVKSSRGQALDCRNSHSEQPTEPTTNSCS